MMKIQDSWLAHGKNCQILSHTAAFIEFSIRGYLLDQIPPTTLESSVTLIAASHWPTLPGPSRMRVDHARARHKRARARAVQQAPEATADSHLEQEVADVGVFERVSGVADEELNSLDLRVPDTSQDEGFRARGTQLTTSRCKAASATKYFLVLAADIFSCSLPTYFLVLAPSTLKSSRAISEGPEIISGHLGGPRNHLGPSRRTLKSFRAIFKLEHLEIISGHLGAPRNHLGPSRSVSKLSGTASTV